MSELRRKALGSGKTVSRKAASRQSSAASSRANSRNTSRANSRAASRANTDDEGSLSDETTFSLGSVDELATIDAELDETTTIWQEELGDRINQITERKKSSSAGREESLTAYVRILCAKYAKEEILSKKSELLDAFVKSLKQGKTEKEALLAAKALAITIVTDPEDTLFDKLAPDFKRAIRDHASLPLKNALIHALGAVAFYGGASVAETELIMDFFMGIVESDGHDIGAGDDAGVVAAALEEWGNLATQLDDAEEVTRRSMSSLVDQLDSSEILVQIAAGENIALLYEKSYAEGEDDEVVEDHSESGLGKNFVQKYKPYPRHGDLVYTLRSLSSGSKKYLSKRNKKTQHSAFVDILHSVENPMKGPRYSEALDKDNRVRGSRMTVRIHKKGLLRVERWWKLHRLQHLRRILAGGFLNHWIENPVIFESLSLFVEEI
ncbi:interferon-related developmental regulator-domain-containing protein [Tuber brumale]|nr:interferon-related developmental regulator-domain-containing protein [Tuber brumale]